MYINVFIVGSCWLDQDNNYFRHTKTCKTSFRELFPGSIYKNELTKEVRNIRTLFLLQSPILVYYLLHFL